MSDTPKIKARPKETQIQPGKVVRRLRLNNHMTIDDLAKKTRLPLIAIIRLEKNGLSCCIRHYIMVAQALNVPVSRLFMADTSESFDIDFINTSSK